MVDVSTTAVTLLAGITVLVTLAIHCRVIRKIVWVRKLMIYDDLG
jgi:hypothetical protein